MYKHDLEQDFMVAMATQNRTGTSRAHGDRIAGIVRADQRDLATRWFNLRKQARASHARRVEAVQWGGRQSLSALAQDSGLVPHPQREGACHCVEAQRINRIAASVVRWEARHRTGSTTISAWAMAAAR